MMFSRMKTVSAMALIGLVSVMAAGSAHAAGVVNSGPGYPSSNSQVTLTATINNVVFVKVDAAQSQLSKNIDPAMVDATANTPSTDFQIRGDVIVNSASANVDCTLSTLALDLTNGTDTIKTNLSGTIGGTAVSTTAFKPTFTSKKASIVINGDIDESTVSSTDAPGDYNGTLTITATLL